MPVLSLACHLSHNAPHIPWRYNYEQTTKQTKAINNSYIYINISCKCDTNRAGHLTLDAYASRPVACPIYCADLIQTWFSPLQASTSTILVSGYFLYLDWIGYKYSNVRCIPVSQQYDFFTSRFYICSYHMGTQSTWNNIMMYYLYWLSRCQVCVVKCFYRWLIFGKRIYQQNMLNKR